MIFSSGPATFTLIVAVLVSGWAGDRYEFLRPSLPEWLQSEPAAVTEYKRKEAAKAKASRLRRRLRLRPHARRGNQHCKRSRAR